MTTRHRLAAFALCTALLAPAGLFAAGNDAMGTLSYKARSADLKYAYLVKGPDAVSKEMIRRVILSATDIRSKIAACKTMSCTDSKINSKINRVRLD